MSFSETAYEIQPLSATSLKEQRECVQTDCQAERVALNVDVSEQWSDLPKTAVEYLTVNCIRPEHLPIAFNFLRDALKENPSLLEDEFEAEMELDDCLSKAEIAAKTDERATNAETIEANIKADQLREQEKEKNNTNIEGLRNKITGNLEGEDKAGQIMQLIADVMLADGFEEAERTAALKHLTQIANTLQEMSGVFIDPAKQTAFEQIVNASALNLGTSTIDATFATVMTQVEKSGAFTEDDKKRLRDIVTSSDLKRETLREVTNPETGEREYAYSKDKPLEFRPGVESFPDAQGREYMKVTLQNGLSHQQEVTSMSLEDRTALAEYYQIWQIAEASGKSDLLHNSFGLALDPFASGRVNWSSLRQSRQIIDALLGGWAGSDGKIMAAEGSGAFIAWQMQWLSKIGDASQDNVDIRVADTNLKALGIKDAEGRINLEVMQAFGSYTQEQYGTGEPSFGTLQMHLFKLYPQFVEKPSNETS